MKKTNFYLFLFFSLIALRSFAQNDTLVSSSAIWKYLDNGSDQGTTWQAPAFNDAAWASGFAQLGYGDGDEATVVSFGPVSIKKYITTYFRKTFSVANAAAYTALQLQLLRDDGAIVYINGTQVVVANMPSGTLTFATTAATNVQNANENKYFIFNLSPSLLVDGNNIIAVELHQFKKTNDDLSFNLRLLAATTCGKPNGLMASNITSASAQLNWNAVGGAMNYTVQYRLNGTTVWTNINSGTNSITINLLNSAAAYQFRIKANCGLTTSTYSSISNFTTLPLAVCDAPLGLNTSNITPGSATLNWDAVANATGYNIQYRTAGSGSWLPVGSENNSVNISSLDAATNYEWEVQAVCPSGPGAFSLLSMFTTPVAPSCDAPAGLSVSGISSVSATVSWTGVPGAVSYTVQYRGVGGNWLSTASVTASKMISGLTPAKTYECSVQSVCQFSNSSLSAPVSFTTGQGTGIADSLVTANSTWKYFVTASDPGSSWKEPSFDVSGWPSGNAELGYGDGDETTLLGFGTDANAKYITTYFRKTIDLPDPSAYASYNLGIVRDDGAVVYINGTEVYRTNLPVGTIAYSTLASTAIANADESAWQNTALNASQFVAGANTIAVEVHQNAGNSSDLSFRMRLSAAASSFPVTVQRGPYLQMLSPGSIHIRWKTDVATSSRIRYGTDMSYGNVIDSNAAVTEHEIKISGLIPGSKYFYTIGSATSDLQGDQNNYFTTALPAGSALPFRVWATGDFGNGSSAQESVRNAYLNYTGNNPANLWIWLGDNAYTTGSEPEFNNYVFAKYTSILKNTPLYPSTGNHDYGSAGYQSPSALGTNFPYFNLFTCPRNGEGGGIASGTEKYYSYNYGNTHFIVIDSYGALNAAGSPMYTWLQNDLTANIQRWTVCYWHHPPYTMGTHNSDSGVESVNIRQNIIPLLENYKVDLVLCGHSHVYERSFLLNGHYGNEGSLTGSMKVDAGSGSAPYYLKSSPAFTGTVYAVVGNSGQGGSITSQTSWPHAAMYSYSKTLYGSMILDINNDSLSAKFISSTGSVFDQFKIVKSGTTRSGGENVIKATKDMEIFPNPFSNETLIRYHLAQGGIAILEIFDFTGRRIFSSEYNSTAGMHETIITEKNLQNKKGLFIVRLTTGSGVINRMIERME